MSTATKGADVQEVRHADLEKNVFDGQKADLFINTGTLGGKKYLVKVTKADGLPVLIAVHL
jgi:hypothetical protein